MLSMDCREREITNPNSVSFGHSKSIDKTSNSKVIMQKQFFETMNNTNLPRQYNNEHY